MRTSSWPFAALLAFVAGFVDTVGFIGLFGLFTAHVTGNFVLIGASIAGSATGVFAKLLALPVFILAVALTALYASHCEKTARPAAPAVLIAQVVLLGMFLTAGFVFAPFTDGDEPLAILTGMIGVAAMAVQNAAGRTVFSTLSPTTVMTGNVTQVVIDLAVGDEGRSARLAKMAPPVAAFALGAIGGGAGFAWIGYWSLALPIAGLAALFVAVLRAPATSAR